MATLTNGAGPAVNLVNSLDISSWLNGTPSQAASNFFSIAAGGGLTVEYGGRFTFGNGTVTGGSIASIDLRLNGELWIEIDLSAPMTVQTLRSFVAVGDTQGFLARVLAGNDTISRPENAADGSPVLFNGFTGNNSITGGRGDDTLWGEIGNDTLNGGSGADSMLGGAGNDTYVVDNAGDVVDETEGSGIDTVVVHAGSLNLAAMFGAIENVVVAGSLGTSVDGNALGNKIAGNGAGNTLRGVDGNDSIDGGGGNDWLEGGNGRDTLIGGDGEDVLIGSNPNGIAPVGDDRDVLNGGRGNDHYVIGENDDGDTVIESAGGGTDTVEYAGRLGRYTLGANVENLELRDGIDRNGTGNSLANDLRGNNSQNQLAGLAGNDTLSGLAGNDTLDGGAGDDSMLGGTQEDLYIVDSKFDVVDETGGDGLDTVKSSVSFDLSGASGQTKGDVEHAILTGMAALNATGNALNNILIGNAGANKLIGNGGDDTLDGGSGNDLLDGGAGRDILSGGLGNDTYIVDNVGDRISPEQTNAAGGRDTVRSSVSLELFDNGIGIEDLVLTGADKINGRGNDQNNLILGNDSDNILVGFDGNDTLTGGSGNDTLFGSDDQFPAGRDILNGGAGNDEYGIVDGDTVIESIAGTAGGTDTVRYFGTVGYTLGANLENLQLGFDAKAGTGNALDNKITAGIFSVGVGGVHLSGLAGNDTIVGNEGGDTLDGGTGADSMVGGVGSDTYIVDNILDIVDETGGSAHGTGDTVVGSVSIDLSSAQVRGDVDHITLTGTAAIDATGNALINVLMGNAGRNVLTGLDGNDDLDGGAGADTMRGGEGGDWYYLDSLADVVDETGADADEDMVLTANFSIDLNLDAFANIEGVGLLGSKALNATGDEVENRLNGNSGANKLSGNGEDDTLEGEAGNDTLDGGIGSDAMYGGKGNDTFIVDDGGDRVIELAHAAEGRDTVRSSLSFNLSGSNGVGIEDLVLTGADAIDGRGNDLHNLILGNDKDNILEGRAGSDTLTGGAGQDRLVGDAGRDNLDGGVGDDILTGGGGDDTLTGGTGNDVFVYQNELDGHDLIRGFDGNAAGGQDVLNLDALFDSLGIAEADRVGRVDIRDRGMSVEVRVNTDGDSSFNLFVATIQTSDAISVGADILVN